MDHLSRYTEAGGDRLVFAVGGDGTVRACATALAHTGAALAIVPRGTANLFARALGVPSDLRAALHCWVRRRRTAVDMAMADGDAFTAMAGIGLDAAVVRSTPRALKSIWGGSVMVPVRWLTWGAGRTTSPCASTAGNPWAAKPTRWWSGMWASCPVASPSYLGPAWTTGCST